MRFVHDGHVHDTDVPLALVGYKVVTIFPRETFSTFDPPQPDDDHVELHHGHAVWHAGDFLHPFGPDLDAALRACGRYVTSTAPIRHG